MQEEEEEEREEEEREVKEREVKEMEGGWDREDEDKVERMGRKWKSSKMETVEMKWSAWGEK